ARSFDVSPPLLNRVIERRPRLALKAGDGLDFTIRRGETFALVGESGCGKSTGARLGGGVYTPTPGRIEFGGGDLAELKSRAAILPLRRRIQMIFQDPYASLDPSWRVREIVAEPIRAHGLRAGEAAVRARVAELLEQVKLAPADGERYPHEFSGG